MGTGSCRRMDGEGLQTKTRSMYPAQHRPQRQGWVHSEWKQSESNQRARYYRITAAGKATAERFEPVEANRGDNEWHLQSRSNGMRLNVPEPVGANSELAFKVFSEAQGRV